MAFKNQEKHKVENILKNMFMQNFQSLAPEYTQF